MKKLLFTILFTLVLSGGASADEKKIKASDKIINDFFKNKTVADIIELAPTSLQEITSNEDGDDWFIMCSYVKKTGAVGHSHTLIRKDVGSWIRCKQSMEKYREPIWSEHYQDVEERVKLFNLKCI